MATSGGIITLRPREFFLYGELVHEIIHLVLGTAAYIANFGFFYTLWPEVYVAGDTIYLINNIIEVFLNLHSIHESREYLDHNHGKLKSYQVGNAMREQRENIIFTLASLFFVAGAVLFEPAVFDGVCGEGKEDCLFMGGLFFALGSVGFLFGFFTNSLSVSYQGALEQQDLNTQLAVIALGCNIFGSAMYLAGSPFYLPSVTQNGYETSCAAPPSNASCVVQCSGTEWPAENTGTAFYVMGGTFFMTAKVFRVWLTVRKHEGEEEERNRLGPIDGRVHAEPRVLVRQQTYQNIGIIAPTGTHDLHVSEATPLSHGALRH